MTRSEIMALSGWELAEPTAKAIGWKMNSSTNYWEDETDKCYFRAMYDSWLPGESADADYEVLKHVRENWDEHNKFLFASEADRIWANRSGYYSIVAYIPGDFARAALIALMYDNNKR